MPLIFALRFRIPVFEDANQIASIAYFCTHIVSFFLDLYIHKLYTAVMKKPIDIDQETRRLRSEAQAELEELTRQDTQLQRRIARLEQFISKLSLSIDAPLVDANEATKHLRRSYGLTGMCLLALKASYKPLTPSEVVGRLKEMGFNIERYESPIAVVTTTLKRLIKKDEVIETKKDGKKAYYYTGSRPISK